MHVSQKEKHIKCDKLIINVPLLTNMSKHISRNRGATIKASQKTAHDKVYYFGAKGQFFPQKMVAPSKKKLYT